MAPGGHTGVLDGRRALAGRDKRSGIAGVAPLSRAVVEPGLAYLCRGAAEPLPLSGPVVEPRSGHVSGGRGRHPEATPCPSRRGHLARVLTHRGVRRRPPQSVGRQAAQDERDAADDDAERAKTLGAVPDPADADLVPLLHCASGLRVSRCQRVDPIPSAVGSQAATRRVNGADHREDGCGGSRRSRPGDATSGGFAAVRSRVWGGTGATAGCSLAEAALGTRSSPGIIPPGTTGSCGRGRSRQQAVLPGSCVGFVWETWGPAIRPMSCTLSARSRRTRRWSRPSGSTARAIPRAEAGWPPET